MAVVLDTGAVSRGSGNKGANKERDIRKRLVDADAVEAVILLPDNLFFNTSAPGVILVARKTDATHPRDHAGEILLINASKFFVKGRPKNDMTDAQIQQVSDLFLHWRVEENVSVIVKQAEVVRNDYNLSPSRYVSHNDGEVSLPLEDALVLLQEAEEARAEADRKLDQVMAGLGFENWRLIALRERAL
jgi:type I restriction enzyme M protein